MSRDISAPPDRVWALISDITRMGEWSPETTGAKWKSGTGPAVGATFTGDNSFGKRSWSTDCTVTECEPGTVFAFKVTSGPVSVAQWGYRLEATDDGCRVTETWTDARNPIIKFMSKFISGVADRPEHNRAGMEQTLDAVKAAAEVA